MNSLIYVGKIAHYRKGQVENSFIYPLYMYAIDLDELPDLHKEVKSFSYNSYNLVSLWDKDYLREGPGTIREKLLEILKKEGCEDGIDKIILLTNLRYFNYVFNPMSTYYCYKKDGSLRCALVEVNNTFGDKHVYIVNNALHEPTEKVIGHFKITKGFHVSPFYDLKGDYEFKFSDIRKNLAIQFDMHNENDTIFKAELTGQKKFLLTQSNLIKTCLKYPFTAWLTMPRIIWQAGKLYFIKKLPVFTRPIPMNENTIRVAKEKTPSLFEKFYMKGVLNMLKHIRKGHLKVKFPDGSTQEYGNLSESPVILTINDYGFFSKLVMRGEIGLGEAYMSQDWDTDNLANILKLLYENFNEPSSLIQWTSKPRLWIDKLSHYFKSNTIEQAPINIRDHYDIMNEMFFKFLDRLKIYSSAIYKNESDTLEQAQLNKIHAIIKKAAITPQDNVVEIGFGWGGFALETVRETGCHLTGITLSKNQLGFTQEEINKMGLQDRFDLKFVDYRNMSGTFDKLVSIEMIEAVGEKHLESYFKKCSDLLKPGGLAVIQAITYPDDKYDEYRKKTDWIQQYIFPGGHLPSLKRIKEIVQTHTDLEIIDVESIGLSYAKTLAEWRKRFLEHKDEIKKLGFDETFIRKFIYYFTYCEVGFETKFIDDLQIVFKKK